MTKPTLLPAFFRNALIIIVLLVLILAPRPAAGYLDIRQARWFDAAGNFAAAAAAYAAGFKVYVVGIGPSLGNLTQLAKAGGTTDFYPVSSPADLVAALSSISTLVGSCSFKSDHAPDDPSNIAVYVNGQQVSQDPNQGWTFGASSQEIVLTGDYCKQMSSGKQVDVQILFGCKGQPPNFPSNIY